MTYRISCLDSALLHLSDETQIIENIRNWHVHAQIAPLKSVGSFRKTVSQLERWYGIFNTYPQTIVQGFNASDIDKAKNQNRTAIIFALDGPAALEKNAGLITVWRQLGVRFLRLYNRGSDLVVRADTKGRGKGLTAFGASVIEMMNKNAMVADLTNAPTKLVVEVATASEYPIFINNLDFNSSSISEYFNDDVVKVLKGNEAILGVNFSALSTNKQSMEESCVRLFKWHKRFAENSFCLNFDVAPTAGESFDQHCNDLIFALAKAGFTKAQINGILGDNWYRLCHNYFY